MLALLYLNYNDRYEFELRVARAQIIPEKREIIFSLN